MLNLNRKKDEKDINETMEAGIDSGKEKRKTH